MSRGSVVAVDGAEVAVVVAVVVVVVLAAVYRRRPVAHPPVTLDPPSPADL